MTLREDVLAGINIVDLINKYVSLKKVGKNRTGLCPFHKEKTPSFTVAEDKQIFKCFGCGKGGNAITFHMEIERLDYRDSIQLLAKEAHLDITQYQKNPEEFTKAASDREKYKLLNKRTQKFFRDSLTPNSKAYEYLRDKRGLSDEIIQQFWLGYAPDSHYELINLLKEKWFSADDLVHAGLAKKGQTGDLYAFFRHRVTFPIVDHIGTVVGFGGRALEADQSPKYLNTTETPLYDKSKILFGLHEAKQHLQEASLLIVVEGYMDVIALHQYRLPRGVATCGTALTQEHIKLLKRYTDTVIFAFDQDDAGFEATIRGIKAAYQQDVYPEILSFPNSFKDIDERLHSLPEAPSVETLKEQSMDWFAFLCSRLQERYNFNNPVERKKSISMLFDVLGNMSDYTILLLYIDQLALLLHADREMLWKQFKSHISQSSVTRTHHAAQEPKQDASEHMLVALYRNRFAAQWDHNGAFYDVYHDILHTFAKHLPGTLLALADTNTLTEEQIQYLKEAQLQREQQLLALPLDKQQVHLMTFLQAQIHTLQKQIFKSNDVSHEEKQRILEAVKSLQQMLDRSKQLKKY